MKSILLHSLFLLISLSCFAQDDAFKIPEGDIKTLSNDVVFDTASFLFGYSIRASTAKLPDFSANDFLDGFEARKKEPKYGISQAEFTAARDEIEKAKAENRDPNPNDLKLISKFQGIQLAIRSTDNCVDLRPQIARKGYAFALSETEASIKGDIIKTYLLEAQTRGVQVILDKNKKWFEANKANEGVVTLPSGLQYQVIKEGTGEKLTGENVVKVNYTGSLIDGTVFDSSKNPGREPFETKVNGQIIEGWKQGLQQMKVGGTYKLFIPHNLGYGDKDQGDTIKAFSILIFEMEVLEIVK